MPQHSYERKTGFNGRRCSGYRTEEIESYTNALLAQESDIDFAGFDAGTYTIRLTNKDGRVIDVSAVGTGVSTLITIQALITAVEALIGTDDSLENILVATENDPALELRFIHPGEGWDISFPSNPNTNMSHDLLQAAGGTDVFLGKFVVRVPDKSDECKAPTGASTDPDFIGITVSNTESLVMDFTTEEPVFEPADTCSVMTKGVAEADCETSAVYGDPVFARITINAPGQKLGAPRNDADGGAAVLVTSAKFYSNTTGASVVKIKISRP